MNWINSPYNAVMEKTLDAMWTRQQVISKNIANADTPGYQRQYVNFEALMDREIEKIRNESGKSLKQYTKSEISNKLSSVRIQIQTDNIQSKADENGVNYDVEQMEFARTQLQYDYALRLLGDNFTRLRTAIGT